MQPARIRRNGGRQRLVEASPKGIAHREDKATAQFLPVAHEIGYRLGITAGMLLKNESVIGLRQAVNCWPRLSQWPANASSIHSIETLPVPRPAEERFR
jgi:hypothetical protein